MRTSNSLCIPAYKALSLLLLAAILSGCMSALPVRAIETGFGNFIIQRYYDNRFKDIGESDWFYADVKTAYELGIIDGRSSSGFEPAGMLTIAEVIKIAACIHKIYTTGSGSFTPGSEWYRVYVDYAKKNGIIVSEYSDYNKSAKRSEAAEIFGRTLPASALAAINSLSDGDIPDVRLSDAYGEAVYRLYAAGILTGGDESKTFNPGSFILRSEISAVITRLTYPVRRIVFPTVHAVTSVIYKYHDFLASGDKLLTFDYSDSYFEAPSNILNGNFVKASVALSTAALGDSASGSDKNIAEALENMGYKILTQQNYDKDVTDDKSDFAAYTIASKNMVVNRKTYTVYSVVIRGSLETAEWYSNFDVGREADKPHSGFTNAAGDLYASLAGYITTPKENTKLWITGHSRGAAVTNIIAAKLTQNGQYAAKDDIYAYTFGCPAVTKTPYKCDNIFNFTNPGDTLALIPFTLWGYGVNGVDIKLPTDSATLAEMKRNFTEITGGTEFLGGYDIDEISGLVLSWCPTKEDFYRSENGSLSPYELFVAIISLGNGDADIFETASILLQMKYDPEGIRVAMYLIENLIPIYHSHIFDMYIAWTDAVY